MSQGSVVCQPLTTLADKKHGRLRGKMWDWSLDFPLYAAVHSWVVGRGTAFGVTYPPRRELHSTDEHQLFPSSLPKSASLMTASIRWSPLLQLSKLHCKKCRRTFFRIPSWCWKNTISLMKFFCCPPMCFFFYPANEQGHSLSLSKKFDSDKELLYPIFSLSKKFDSDNEGLIDSMTFFSS